MFPLQRTGIHLATIINVSASQYILSLYVDSVATYGHTPSMIYKLEAANAGLVERATSTFHVGPPSPSRI
jgi:hypothetical protein